jgi:hypothetical protein
MQLGNSKVLDSASRKVQLKLIASSSNRTADLESQVNPHAREFFYIWKHYHTRYKRLPSQPIVTFCHFGVVHDLQYVFHVPPAHALAPP